MPHSGTYVPPSVKKQLRQDPVPVLSPVDWHLEKLYDFLPELGITVLQATHSRYVVNLNRELKPPLFGLESSSVVSEENCFMSPLYDRELNESEVEERINRYYLPYHRQLEQTIKKMLRDYNRIYLVDLHSYFRGPLVDVCLGNVNETTCSENLIGCFERVFQKNGFSVTRNEVWIGGYITRHYGNMDNVESLQIELRFPSYLEGENFEEDDVIEWDSDKFRNARKRLRKVFGEVMNELCGV